MRIANRSDLGNHARFVYAMLHVLLFVWMYGCRSEERAESQKEGVEEAGPQTPQREYPIHLTSNPGSKIDVYGDLVAVMCGLEGYTEDKDIVYRLYFDCALRTDASSYIDAYASQSTSESFAQSSASSGFRKGFYESMMQQFEKEQTDFLKGIEIEDESGNVFRPAVSWSDPDYKSMSQTLNSLGGSVRFFGTDRSNVDPLLDKKARGESLLLSTVLDEMKSGSDMIFAPLPSNEALVCVIECKFNPGIMSPVLRRVTIRKSDGTLQTYDIKGGSSSEISDGAAGDEPIRTAANSEGAYWYASQDPLDESDLRTMSKAELRIMRNEIYARHGYIFKSADLRAHFEAEGWYEPRYANVDHLLTPIERKNLDLIKKYEK